jgi:uracil-DNA glycosylase
VRAAAEQAGAERDTCRPFLERELGLLDGVRVVVALGQYGWDAVCAHYHLRPKPRFGHGAEVSLEGGRTLLGSYHVSQQNTFTGKLTPDMLDAIFRRARRIAQAVA